jgi:hypothetical protein
MNRIILYIFSKTSLGKLLDGKKTIIGAVFIIAAAALEALEQIAPMFPQYPWLQDAARGTREALLVSEKALEGIGLGFLTAGVLHKKAKADEKA